MSEAREYPHPKGEICVIVDETIDPALKRQELTLDMLLDEARGEIEIALKNLTPEERTKALSTLRIDWDYKLKEKAGAQQVFGRRELLQFALSNGYSEELAKMTFNHIEVTLKQAIGNPITYGELLKIVDQLGPVNGNGEEVKNLCIAFLNSKGLKAREM